MHGGEGELLQRFSLLREAIKDLCNILASKTCVLDCSLYRETGGKNVLGGRHAFTY